MFVLPIEPTCSFVIDDFAEETVPLELFSSIVQLHDLQLEPLFDHLEYAYLEEDEQLLNISAKNYQRGQKTSGIVVASKYDELISIDVMDS